MEMQNVFRGEKEDILKQTETMAILTEDKGHSNVGEKERRESKDRKRKEN